MKDIQSLTLIQPHLFDCAPLLSGILKIFSAFATSGAGCVALSDLLFQPFWHIVKNFTAFVQAFIKIGKHFSRRVSVDTSDIKNISLVNRYGVSKIDFLKYFFEMPLIHLLFPFRPLACPLFLLMVII